MDTGIWVAIVVVEAAVIVTLTALWLLGRRRQRRLRAKLAAAREAHPRKAVKRLVPTPDEFVKGVFETVDRVREHGVGGAIRGSIADLAGWAEVERPNLVTMAGPDGSVTILFSDIEGSTQLNEQLGDRQWVRLLAGHDQAVRSAIERYDGHVVKTQGDGFMAAFSNPEQAVRAAISIQRGFAKGRRRGMTPVRIRIGIHHGDVVHRSGDIFGRNVAHAARVAALAEGRQILVSGAVADAVDECEDIVLTEEREVELKGLTGAHVVAAVDWAA